MLARNGFSKFLILFLTIFQCQAKTTRIKEDITSGSLVFDGHRYLDVIGVKDGVYRAMISINGAPSLYVGGQDEIYYTLEGLSDRLFINCAYIDKRNKYNGASIEFGICALGLLLSNDYSSSVYAYGDIWNKIFSFDTSIVKKHGSDFFIGKIGEIAVFNRYISIDALERSAPETYIKSISGCHSFGEKKVFLVFHKGNLKNPLYLDVLQSTDPMELKRLKESDLKKLAIERCI